MEKNGDVGVSVSTTNRAELERLPATEAGSRVRAGLQEFSEAQDQD